jgi:hypothetical protein
MGRCSPPARSPPRPAADAPADRSQGRPRRHPALVRSPLVYRGDLRRGPSPPRRRDPTAVIRSRNRADNAGLARPILARHAMGARTTSRSSNGVASRRLVSKATSHLQRRTGTCPPRTMDATRFRHLRKHDRLVEMPRSAINALIGAACYAA